VEPPQPRAEREVAFAPEEPKPPEEGEAPVQAGPSATPEPPEAREKELVAVAPEEPEPPESVVEAGPEIAEAGAPPEREEERPPREEARPGEKPREERPGLAGLEEEKLRADPATGRIYFIQIGAYTDETLARSVEATYANNYPIDVYRSGRGTKGVFRVLVGPLNKDESGAVLYWFRAKGFKDAFIRSVQ
jgi:hypothetical protein